MAPAGQYVFAEMPGISEYFTAGSHEWLPYSVIPTFPKLICKQQFIVSKTESGVVSEIFTISAFTSAQIGTIMHLETVPGTVPGKNKEE